MEVDWDQEFFGAVAPLYTAFSRLFNRGDELDAKLGVFSRTLGLWYERTFADGARPLDDRRIRIRADDHGRNRKRAAKIAQKLKASSARHREIDNHHLRCGVDNRRQRFLSRGRDSHDLNEWAGLQNDADQAPKRRRIVNNENTQDFGARPVHAFSFPHLCGFVYSGNILGASARGAQLALAPREETSLMNA
jgi:hypothetical protein